MKDPPDHRGGLRILIAEDNPVNQMLLTCACLKSADTLSKWQPPGRLALVSVEEDSYDLLLMDMQMPEMDGMQATRALRERESKTGTHLTVVGVTAHAMAGDRERCLQAGMDAYLSKPIRPAELDELGCGSPRRPRGGLRAALRAFNELPYVGPPPSQAPSWDLRHL